MLRRVPMFLTVLIVSYTFITMASTPSPALEGLPIECYFISKILLPDGTTKITYRTKGFIPTESDDTWLLKDSNGLQGTYDDLVWVHVPSDSTVTLFPGYFPSETFVLPGWVSLVTDYAVTHPDVSVVSQKETIWQRVGDIVSVSYLQTVPPPVTHLCDPNSYLHPFYLQYEGIISGDLSGFSFPQTVTHYLYRIGVQSVTTGINSRSLPLSHKEN